MSFLLLLSSKEEKVRREVWLSIKVEQRNVDEGFMHMRWDMEGIKAAEKSWDFVPYWVIWGSNKVFSEILIGLSRKIRVVEGFHFVASKFRMTVVFSE